MSLRCILFILPCVILRVCDCCPNGFTQCALNYGASCDVSNATIVSYGNDNDGVYSYQQASSPIQCTNSQFGGALGTTGICCRQNPVLNSILGPLIGSISCNETKAVWIDSSIHYWQLTNVKTKLNNITYSTCSGHSDFDTSLTLYNSTGTMISGPFCKISNWGYSDCGNCPGGSTDGVIYTVPSQQTSAMSATYIRVSYYSTTETTMNGGSGYYDLSVTCKPVSATQTTASPITAVPTTLFPTTLIPTALIPTPSTLTTASPITAVPSTTSPTTLIPTSLIPTSLIPTTLIPTTLVSTTLIPTSSTPTTSSPTGFSGGIKTTSITVTMEQTVNNMNEQFGNGAFETNEIVLFGIGFICFVLVITSYIHSHCISFNDYYKVSSVVTAGLQIMDMFSDVFFVIEISNNPQFGASTPLLIMYTLSITCIAIPMIVSLFQLHHEIGKHWMKNDQTRIWIAENIKFLYFLSILSGSTFSATTLCTSNMFNLSFFDMPLTKNQLLSFRYKRVYSSVVLENIPQLFIQVWYIFHSSSSITFSGIVAVSMLFSVISIVIAVISMATQKKISYSQDSVNIQFDATGKCIIGNIKRCKNRTKKIRSELSAVLGVTSNLLEITRPEQIPNGIKLNMNIFVSNTRAIDVNYQQMMELAQQNGQIASILQKHWKLDTVPVINNIKYQTNASKLRTKNMVFIKNEQMTRNEMMMVQINNTDGDESKVHIVEDDCVMITSPGFTNTDDYSCSEESQNKATPGGKSTKNGDCDKGNDNDKTYLNVNSQDDQEIIGDDEITQCQK